MIYVPDYDMRNQLRHWIIQTPS